MLAIASPLLKGIVSEAIREQGVAWMEENKGILQSQADYINSL
jgi:hypothetical protein